LLKKIHINIKFFLYFMLFDLFDIWRFFLPLQNTIYKNSLEKKNSLAN